MLTKLRESREREEGFTLIELLVVVIIIGILAAVAIPVFLNQRQSAWQRAAELDARNAAIAVESYYTSEGSYPDMTGDAAEWGPGADTVGLPNDTNPVATVTVSEGVTLNYATTGGGFTIEARHSELGNDPVALYNSLEGGIVDPPAGTGGS